MSSGSTDIVYVRKLEWEARQKSAAVAAPSAAPKDRSAAPSAAPNQGSAAHLGHGRRLSKDTLDSIVDYKLHYPNASNRAIAKHFGVNERTVRRQLN
jgi:hypothetical protein